MPQPHADESQEDFISRCIRQTIDEGTTDDPKQAAAICYSKWRDKQFGPKDMSIHQQLIARINARKGGGLKFGQGFWTADKFVNSLMECVGPGMCQRRFGAQQGSLAQLVKEAAGKLTYCGDSLSIDKSAIIEVKLATSTSAIKSLLGDIALPKHSLMAFAHTLTTPREDRDGDVLETDGAVVDAKMPMLWQHVHTLPIGRALKTIEKSPERLRMASVLLDMNELTHDAAILIEADALRFSHGFRALEFSERNKEVAGAPGFRVKSFEIMEESLVSVPSNIDAEIEVFSRGKLKSIEFKTHAKALSRLRTKAHPGVNMNFASFADLKSAADAGQITVGGKPLEVVEPEHKHDHATGDCGCGGKCGKCGDAKAGKDGKASLDRESFATREEAEARATILGCAGSHFSEGKWHPCQDEWDYMLYAKPTVDPAQAKPTGRASATPKTKIYMDSSALDGSYMNRLQKLGDSAGRFLMATGMDIDNDDSAYVWALFDNYGIICVRDYSGPMVSSGDDDCEYYRADWSEQDGQPKWSGVPTPVEVSSDISISETSKAVRANAIKTLAAVIGSDKAGRTLSQANVDRLQEIKNDLAAIVAGDLPREMQALAQRAMREIEDLISSAVPVLDEDPQPKSFTSDSDALVALLDSKSVEFLKGSIKAINAVINVHAADKKAAGFKKLLRR